MLNSTNRFVNKIIGDEYLLWSFLKRWFSHEHEIYAAASGPKVDTFAVHLTAEQDLRSSVDVRTDSRCEHFEVHALS